MRKYPAELLPEHLQQAVSHVAECEGCGVRRLAATMVEGSDRNRGEAEGPEEPAEAAPARRARDATGDSSPLLPRRSQVQARLQREGNSLPFLRAAGVREVSDLFAAERALAHGTRE